MILWMKPPHPKSPLRHVWCLYVLWKGRYNIFDLSPDITFLHDQRDMWLGEWKPLTLSHHSTKFPVQRSCGSRDKTFRICHMTTCNHVTIGYAALWVRAPNSESPLCHVWGLQVLRKWRYNVFILSHVITWLFDQSNISLWKWEPLNLSHHCAKYEAYRYWGSGNVILCRHVTSRDHTVKGRMI